eukprot:SAG31_NODE_1625_length_7716_cov_23.849941_9_plen_57_part_00
MVLVGGAIFHFCDPTSLEKVAKIHTKGFVVQKQCAFGRRGRGVGEAHCYVDLLTRT